jgi:8-oxo-dGTP pyrophosphatase MutT (NUDIX family)
MIIRILFYGYRLFRFFWRPITLGVRILMVCEGHVVLVRHTYLRGWYLPGGGLKRGETLEDAARREAYEEAGAELGELQLMGAYTKLERTKSDHNILFLCRDFKLSDHHDGEIAEVKLFPLHALPEDLKAGHRRRIRAFADDKAEKNFGLW